METREGGTGEAGSADPPDSTDDPTPDVGEDAAELIGDAIALYDEADAILREGGAGSIAEYQAKLDEAQELVRQAQEALVAEQEAPQVDAEPISGPAN